MWIRYHFGHPYSPFCVHPLPQPARFPTHCERTLIGLGILWVPWRDQRRLLVSAVFTANSPLTMVWQIVACYVGEKYAIYATNDYDYHYYLLVLLWFLLTLFEKFMLYT